MPLIKAGHMVELNKNGAGKNSFLWSGERNGFLFLFFLLLGIESRALNILRKYVHSQPRNGYLLTDKLTSYSEMVMYHSHEKYKHSTWKSHLV
jgi:hypothetical protein